MEVTLCSFPLNPKYYQNEIWPHTSVLITNISNMFLAQYLGLEISSRYFYDFNEIPMLHETSQFLRVDTYHFQFCLIHPF